MLTVLVSTAFLVDHVVRTSLLYHLWSDRDMIRSDVPYGALPNMGAELGYGIGARIPGGAMHTVQWLVLCLRDDPVFAWRVQWALLGIAAALLGREVGRRFGPIAGAVTFAHWLASPLVWLILHTLWNPGWTPIFLAVALVAWMRAVLDRDGRGVIAFAACLAVGATAHLSVWLVAASAIPVWIAARPATSWRRVGLAALAVVATFTPYLVDEARSGWRNTREMFAPQQTELVMPALSTTTPGHEAAGIVYRLSGAGGLGLQAESPWVLVGAVAFVLGVLGLSWVRRSDADGRLLRATSALLALFVAAYMVAAVDASTVNNSRYLLVATPVFAVLLGGLTASLLALAPRVRLATAGAALALPLGLFVSGRSSAEADLRAPEIYAYGHLVDVLDAVRATTGWSLSEVAGRTLTVRVRGGVFERHRNVPIAWPLAQAGEVFPGSLAPPCAMYVAHDPGVDASSWATPASLAGALVVDRVASVDRIVPLGEREDLVLYTPEAGRCPTSFDQRYVLTPEEQLTWSAWTGHAEPPVRRLPEEAGASRWLVSWDAGGADTPTVVLGLLTLAVRDGQAEVALHANQLRGEGWNYGFFGNASVRGVRLVGRDAAGVEVGGLDLATGVVGGFGALTPLRVRGPWPPGAVPELVIGVDPALLPWRGATPPSEPRLVVIPLR